MMKHVELKNGVKLAYEDVGEKEPIVLLHGFCGSSQYWKKVIPLLSASHRVIAPDLRGHGASSAPDETYTMERFAEDLALFVDALGLSGIHLFGHSLGGYVTLAFAQKHADKLASYGLIHSTGFPDDEAAKANRDKGARSIAENGLEPFIKVLVPKLFAPSHVASMPGEVQLAKEIGLSTDPAGPGIRWRECGIVLTAGMCWRRRASLCCWSQESRTKSFPLPKRSPRMDRLSRKF